MVKLLVNIRVVTGNNKRELLMGRVTLDQSNDYKILMNINCRKLKAKRRDGLAD